MKRAPKKDDNIHYYDEANVKCIMQHLGTKWFCTSDFGCGCWSGAPSLDRLPAKAEGARSTHQWLRMHWPLTSFSPPAEAVCRGVATVIPNSFLEPEVRVECWVRTSVPTHPEGCCCRVYKGTTSPQTPRHLAWTDATEGQALWQPGGAEEDSRLHEGNRHLHLAYDEEEDYDYQMKTKIKVLPSDTIRFTCIPIQISTKFNRSSYNQAWLHQFVFSTFYLCLAFLTLYFYFFFSKTSTFLLL